MYKALENSLFSRKPEKFENIRVIAREFNGAYNGNNIVQDDVFGIIENYTGREGRPLELFHIPIEDQELCACTFLRGDRIFAMINSNMILAKQIFAAAHELYHIYCYFEGENMNLSRHGSILTSSSMDAEEIEAEDMEANAFAGLFLAPSVQISERMDIYGIDTKNILFADILKLIDLFAIPYKAMLLRLYEEKYLNEARVRDLFSIGEAEVIRQIKITGKGKRWYRIPSDRIGFGSLMENFEVNKQLDALNEHRLQTDEKRIAELYEMLKQN
ncbi:MAG: ImmA/IrrE family metallo-endopeptidase [Lachnospiraceae bacterium]|nr:ImmA/IrrE family metallo-endopeptidase [Lachnospiraceae bacterium]